MDVKLRSPPGGSDFQRPGAVSPDSMLVVGTRGTVMLLEKIAPEVALELPPDRMDVIRILADTVVLDEELRALDPVVVSLFRLGRSHPGEMNLVETGLPDRFQVRRSNLLVEALDIDCDEREELLLLWLRHLRVGNPRGLEGLDLGFPPGQYVPGSAFIENRLRLKFGRQALQQRPGEVFLRSQRPVTLAIADRDLRGIRPEEGRGHRTDLARFHGEVDREVMPLHPPSPGGIGGRLSEYREKVAPGIAVRSAAHVPEHLLECDHFLRGQMALLAEDRGEHRMGFLTLGVVHFTEGNPGAFARQVRPGGPAFLLEWKNRGGPLLRRESCKPGLDRLLKLGSGVAPGGGWKHEREKNTDQEKTHPEETKPRETAREAATFRPCEALDIRWGHRYFRATMRISPVLTGVLSSGGWLLLGTIQVLLTACGPENTYQAPPPPEVTVEVMEPRDTVTFLTFSGRTQASDSVELRARVKGFLQSVDFHAGDVVDQGKLLFQIDPRPFQAAVSAAEGQLASAQASLQLAIATLQKNEQLFARKVISEIDILQFRAEQDSAVAAVRIAQAELEARQLDLSFTTIAAPFKGRMSRSLVDPGNLVGGNDLTLLSTIIRPDPIYAYFQLDERTVVDYLIEAGERGDRSDDGDQIAFLQFANSATYDQKGRLDYVDNQVNPRTGTLEARASFPNPNGIVVPGIFVRIQFPMPLEQEIVIPNVALLKDLGGNYVLTVGENDMVQQSYVTMGPRIGTAHTVVETGLKAGDRVIVLGQQRARPGAPVKPTVREPAALPSPDAAPPAPAAEPPSPEATPEATAPDTAPPDNPGPEAPTPTPAADASPEPTAE